MQALIILVSCGAAALPSPERGYLHLMLVSPGTLLLRAASEWRTMFSFKKRHVPTYLSYCPLLPFFWPSKRRKSYFHQVKELRHETDGGLNNAPRYRRSCSDTKKSPLPITEATDSTQNASGSHGKFLSFFFLLFPAPPTKKVPSKRHVGQHVSSLRIPYSKYIYIMSIWWRTIICDCS